MQSNTVIKYFRTFRHYQPPPPTSRLKYFLSALLLLAIPGCRKFLEISPPKTSLISETVFQSDITATSAVLGIYSNMMQDQKLASINITRNLGLSADEFVDFATNSELTEFYSNALTTANPAVRNLWGDAYQSIFAANQILDGLENASMISNAVKQQLTGEAKFIRSFFYFYLVNLFGDVPLITSTDYRVNSLEHRSPQTDIYNLIISDLKEAETFLSDNYLKPDNTSSTDRTRPNKWAATALLARVYLYTKDWTNAEIASTSVINNVSRYSLVSNLNNVFLKNSMEAIWQLMPVSTIGINTWEGFSFILTSAPTGNTAIALNSNFVNSFETDDARKTAWMELFSAGSQSFFYPYKYKVKTSPGVSGANSSEYYMVLRHAEQYLIRAEARAERDNLSGAISDINTIRKRAGLKELQTSLSKDQTLAAIVQERKAELFAEWGHRWLDLKRTNRADSVLSTIKPKWQSTDKLYPIPQTEIENDPNLTQNTGY